MIDTDVAVEAQRILDRLYHVLYQNEECGLDIEVQSRSYKDILARMFKYAKRASFIYDLPMMSIVLWLHKGGDTFTHKIYEERVGDRLLGTWHVYGIEIFRLHARAIIEGGVLALLPLVPFMQGADIATIEEAAQKVDHEVSGELGTTPKTLLAVFTAQFHGQGVAKALLEKLKMDMSIVAESPLYQEWIQQARAEGKEQGIAEAMRAMVQRTLEGRFTTLDADLLAAITTASEATLNEVITHVATDSLAQIRARFGL